MTEEEPAAIGVDIGGTTTKLALVAREGRIGNAISIPTGPGDAPRFVETVLRSIADLLAENEGRAIAGIGVAVAGFIGAEHDRVAYNPNVPWLEDYPLREAIASRFPLPVTLECDSNAACLAEYRFGEGRGAKRLLGLVCGTGIGGGMVVDGRILRFAHECLGDAGHVIVVPDGPLCPCGGRGCAEAVISAPAIAAKFARARGLAIGSCTLKDAIEAAREGCEDGRRVLEEAGKLLGIAMATLAHLLFPDRIVVAGGLSEAGQFLFPAVERAFRSSAGTLPEGGVKILKAAFGWQATLVGAACPFL